MNNENNKSPNCIKAFEANRQAAIMLAFSFLAILAYIFFAPPCNDSKFYPPCLFHQISGLYCPSCGSTRAAHHLLHGRLMEAFSSNPLATFAIPPLIVFLIMLIRFACTGKTCKHPPFKMSYIWYLLIPLLLFGVLRNLPFYPFTLLIPPK